MSDKKGKELKITGYIAEILSVVVWVIGASLSSMYAESDVSGWQSPVEVAFSVLNGFIFFGALLAIFGTIFIALGIIVEKLSEIENNTRPVVKQHAKKEKSDKQFNIGDKDKPKTMESSDKYAEDNTPLIENERILQEAEMRVMLEAQPKQEAEKKAKLEAKELTKKKAEEEKTRVLAEKRAKQEEKEKEMNIKQKIKEDAEKGIATIVKINKFGEAICPLCNTVIECGDKLGIQKCSHCGCPIQVVKG